MRTKAVIFTGVNKVEVGEVDIPKPGPTEVLVRTIMTGISVGTDGWYIKGLYLGGRIRYPTIYGYQRVGIIEELGSRVDTVGLGDRVFVGTARTRLEPGSVMGDSAGNYTGFGCHDASVIVPIPDQVSNIKASMGGVTATPVVGRNLTGPQQGDLVLILGQGMIGQMAAQLYRDKGARVITADILANRVDISQKISADIAVNSSEEDVVDIVHREQEAGADIVVECTGRSDTMGQMLRAVRGQCNDSEKSGKISMQGYFVDPINIDFHSAHLRRLTMSFPCGFDVSGTREILGLMAENRVNVADLITHEWSVDQAPEAFSLMLSNPGEVLGMYMRW